MVPSAVKVIDMNSINIEELALKVLGTSAFKNLQSKQAVFSNVSLFQLSLKTTDVLNCKLLF
jgi:S-adenosylmethionine:diacylglycerol 3-amino-3-carboxypropyl transferase